MVSGWCFKLLVGCTPGTSSSVIASAVRNKCMSTSHPPSTPAAPQDASQFLSFSRGTELSISLPLSSHVWSVLKGSNWFAEDMASICAVARIFLYLNIVRVYLGNSSELNGDIPATEPSFHNPARDMMTVNMYRVYDKYSKKQHHHQQQENVNTIRSFRGVPGE